MQRGFIGWYSSLKVVRFPPRHDFRPRVLVMSTETSTQPVYHRLACAAMIYVILYVLFSSARLL